MNEHFDVLRQYVQGKAVEHGKLIRAIGFVLDFTIELHEQSGKVRKVDNGDGTVTIHGLPVTVPSTLIPEGEVPVEVRSLSQGIERRLISSGGNVMPDGISGGVQHKGDLRIILADNPQPVTWTPPAKLPDGEYVWNGTLLSDIDRSWLVDTRGTFIAILVGGWVDPPRKGRYRKAGSTATWIGE